MTGSAAATGRTATLTRPHATPINVPNHAARQADREADRVADDFGIVAGMNCLMTRITLELPRACPGSKKRPLRKG